MARPAMSFHLGKPILVMIAVGQATGAAILLRAGKEGRADLVVWTFADQHYNAYTQPGPDGLSLAQRFARDKRKSVDVKLISNRALNVRLISMFNADLSGPDVPDLVEVEISHIGKYFRPPLDEVGFTRLDGMLQQTGWSDRIIKSRFTPWSKQDAIFGMPHDVHPVTLSYRKDLFDESEIKLDQCATWPQFQQACLDFQRYWRQKGVRNRWALELPQAASSYLLIMLQQRGINLIDRDGRIRMNDSKTAQTLAFYAQMVAGDRRIGSEVSAGDACFSQDLAQGAVCIFWTPDWRLAGVKDYARSVSGKLAMMRLPRFDETKDAPTGTWGGTMIAIPKRSRNHDLAFELIEQLYLKPEVIDAQERANVQILPPVIAMWDDDRYKRPDPFYGGQYVNQLFIQLAHQIPPRYVSPATTVADQTLTYVLTRAVDRVKSGGIAGLEEACQQWLDEAADDLRRRIDHGKFD
jgi:ABC-type glycerol-3-phosphate transport system substrate-binding protein